MISSGIVNALIAWASGDEDKIARLVAERDALIESFISGGKAAGTLTSASLNGKSFNFDPTLTREDKLSLLTTVLIHLDEIDPATLPPSVTYGNFADIQR